MRASRSMRTEITYFSFQLETMEYVVAVERRHGLGGASPRGHRGWPRKRKDDPLPPPPSPVGDPRRWPGSGFHRPVARATRQPRAQLPGAGIIPEDGRHRRRHRSGVAHAPPDGGSRAVHPGRVRRVRGRQSVPCRRGRPSGGAFVPGREDPGHVLARQLDHALAPRPKKDPFGRVGVAPRREALCRVFHPQRHRGEGLRVPRSVKRATPDRETARSAPSRLDHALLPLPGIYIYIS